MNDCRIHNKSDLVNLEFFLKVPTFFFFEIITILFNIV